MRGKKKINQRKKATQDCLIFNNLPSLHLFANENSNHGPYFDIEFLKNYKLLIQEKLCNIIEMISPSNR